MKKHIVREFVQLAFSEVGIDIEWQGNGVEEEGIDKSNGKVLVDINPRYFRPAEVDLLLGDSSKAEKELGWKRKIDFKGLISMMVNSDMKEIVGISTVEYLNKKIYLLNNIRKMIILI